MMHRLILLLTLLCAFSVRSQAQDEVLQKYTEMGDVNTTYVSKGMLQSVPLDQFGVPGLSDMASRIDQMKVLVSRGDKAGKQMGTKLPKQLMSHGFEQKFTTTAPDGSHIRMLQSRLDPSRVVMVVYQKPHATVVSMKGDFSTASLGELIPAE